MKYPVIYRLAVSIAVCAMAAAAVPAFAGPSCTEEPKTKWLTEEQMKKKIEEMGYKDIKNFHVSKGKCYEIYGVDKDGKKVEVYFHPVTGAIAEANFQ
jgi:hypothetical protein